MRKGIQEKLNNIYRVVVEVKLGKESWNYIVVSFEYQGKKFIFSLKVLKSY